MQKTTDHNHAALVPPTSWPPALSYVGLAMIVMLALGLRLWAVAWSLPYVDHPDEQAVANAALGMLKRGDWNPRFFDYPSFDLYALRLAFSAHWLYGRATGLYHSVQQLPIGPKETLTPHAFFLSAPGFYVWGRGLSALFGAATVALLFWIGRRHWNAQVGLAAAVLLAVLPFHVRHSQYLTVDIACTFTTLLALGAILRLLDQRGWRAYALAGLTIGLAAGTKYQAGALLLPFVAAHVLAWRRASVRQSWRLPLAGLAALVGFALVTPYAVLTPHTFIDGILGQYRDYRGGEHGDVIGRWPILAYLSFFWNTGLGALPMLAAGLGIAAVVAWRDRAGVVLLSLIVPLMLFFLAWPQHFWRNLLPLFPPLALLAGLGFVLALHQLCAWFDRTVQAKRTDRMARAGWLLAPVLLCLVLAGPLVDTLRLNRFDTGSDARLQAEAYVRAQLPGALIAAEFNPAQLQADPDPAITAVSSLTAHDAAWYRAHGFRYLIANERYRANSRDNERSFDTLRAATTLVATFDDRPLADQIGGATRLARTFASRYCDAQIEVLDLQQSPQGWLPPASLQRELACERPG